MKKLLLFLLLAVAPLRAANVVLSGFETQSTIELGTNVNGTIDTSTKRTGCCALSLAAGTNFAFIPKTGLNKSTLYTRFYTRVHITTNPSSTTVFNSLSIYNGAADVANVHIVVTSGGALSFRLYNSIGAAQVGSDSSFSADTWYLVEIKTVISATVGVLELKVNGSVVATGSSLNTGATNVDSVVAAAYQATLNGLVATVWFDDVLASDSGYPGPGKIICRQAGLSGTPTYNAFNKTGALPGIWADIPYNAATFADSGNGVAAQTYFIGSFSSTQSGHGTETIAAGDTINAVMGTLVGNTGLTTTFDSRRRVNGVNTDSPITPNATPFLHREPPWTDTLTNINAMEFGADQNGTGTGINVYDIYVFVDYLPVEGSATVIHRRRRR